MGGLAVGLITGRRELVAAIAGAVLGVVVALAWDPAAGIIAGGVLGPAMGIAVRPGTRDHDREGQLAFGPEPMHDHDGGHAHEHDHRPEHEHAVPFFPQRSDHARGDPEADDR
jgi:hypothetical protein